MTALFAWVSLALGLQLAATLVQPGAGSFGQVGVPNSQTLVFGTIRYVSATTFSLCMRSCVRVIQSVPVEWEGKKAWAEGRLEKNFLIPKSKNAVDVIG